jgi:copper chaperone CopZ
MKTVITIPGIHCPACIGLLRELSTDFPAVTDVTGDPATKHVTIEHEDGFDLAAWAAMIEAEAGETYRVSPSPKANG